MTAGFQGNSGKRVNLSVSLISCQKSGVNYNQWTFHIGISHSLNSSSEYKSVPPSPYSTSLNLAIPSTPVNPTYNVPGRTSPPRITSAVPWEKCLYIVKYIRTSNENSPSETKYVGYYFLFCDPWNRSKLHLRSSRSNVYSTFEKHILIHNVPQMELLSCFYHGYCLSSQTV